MQKKSRRAFSLIASIFSDSEKIRLYQQKIDTKRFPKWGITCLYSKSYGIYTIFCLKLNFQKIQILSKMSKGKAYTYNNFKTSGYSKAGIYKIMSKFDKMGNVDRKSGSGRPPKSILSIRMGLTVS